MRTALLSGLILVVTAMPLSSDRNCDRAYVAFMEHLSRTAAAEDGNRLADFHRNALRIFYACDSGHMQKPEALLRELEQRVL
jgi:hypothetical protein